MDRSAHFVRLRIAAIDLIGTLDLFEPQKGMIWKVFRQIFSLYSFSAGKIQEVYHAPLFY